MSFASDEVAARRHRIESVDVLRGIIMIVMALDHTRDYFSNTGLNPTDPATTTVALFFTRWITHYCAPVFFLLTGTGAYLSLRRKTRSELSRFLFTRGLWLIFLEIVVVRCLGWQFNFNYHLTVLAVLWALGWAMMVLAALVYLPAWAVTTFGVVMIATHNLLDRFDWANPVWKVLHEPAPLFINRTHAVMDGYSLIPWVGVTAAGYGLGQVYGWPAERRRRFLLRLGLAVTAGFILLRWTNVYGDASQWATQRSPVYTVLSFLNATKYPPSLLYLMMTLGPALVLLWAVDGGTPGWLRPALTVGEVPMFYYLLHIPLIHLIAVAVCLGKYHADYWMFQSNNLGQFPVMKPPGWGFSLPVVYLVWAAVVITLYPACRWYAGVKRRSNSVWLSYL